MENGIAHDCTFHYSWRTSQFTTAEVVEVVTGLAGGSWRDLQPQVIQVIQVILKFDMFDIEVEIS